ncbi:hypothetical protein DERP_011525 [Dermatophagoides pteronyssinus]|uniref:Ig-like domain-containing protein n=1 Tax=Dermatophagoides pteronyssinus TaxID=6956 RepID=A0ABQ8JCW2_DERPT|nr:hypothetical protein DERP_011525 [Dermatophagoides pteronyssinus]
MNIIYKQQKFDFDADDADKDLLLDYYDDEKILQRKIRQNILPNRVKKPLIEAHQHQIYSDVNAIDGRLIRLPCFVRQLNPSDSISLVLWYRGDDISGSPIYSVDASHQSFEYAQHFIHKNYQHKQLMNFTLNQQQQQQQQSINFTLNQQKSGDINNSSSKQQQQQQLEIESKFKTTSSSMPSTTTTTTTTLPTITSKPISKSTAHLYIMPIEEKDSGLYWCRVDYKWERTTISTVTLNVIVPPRQLQILLKMDRNNYFNTKLNRSRNGDDFNTNLENNHEQKSSLTTTTTTNLSTTTLQHQTKSSSISNDNNKMIMLKSLEPNQTIVLNEDESATLICLSEGGKPLPLLNWYRNNQIIRQQIFHILTEKNNSLQSELHLTPIKSDDHNCWFKCLSSNDNQTFLNLKILMKVNSKWIFFSIFNFQFFSFKSLHIRHRQISIKIKTTTTTTAATSKQSFVSGQEIIIRCRSYGSRPPANHSWYLMPGYRPIPILE